MDFLKKTFMFIVCLSCVAALNTAAVFGQDIDGDGVAVPVKAGPYPGRVWTAATVQLSSEELPVAVKAFHPVLSVQLVAQLTLTRTNVIGEFRPVVTDRS